MKRFALIMIVLSMMAVIVGITSAQGRPNRSQARAGIIREVLEATSAEIGLPVSDILAQLLPDGATLADVIESNGGSVEAVVGATVTSATERVSQAVADDLITQEQADNLLANLEQLVTDGINGDLNFTGGATPRRDVERALMTAITDATGLDARSVLQQVRAGKTPAQIIEENGSSVDVVVASAMEMATERINNWVENERITQVQADDLLVSLEQAFTDILNGEFEQPFRNGGIGRPGGRDGRNPVIGVIRQIVDQTGLTPQELLTQLRDGATPADILSANGVDVTAFVDGLLVNAEERLTQAVERGRLTQEQVDERLATMRTTLTDRLNNPLPDRTISPEAGS